MSKILLLEDDLSLINGLSFAFRKQGFELAVVRTLKEANELWGEGKYDLLVLDVSLPDGTGYEFCKKVRQVSKVPIIFLTASDEEMNIIMGLDIGGDDYITKPFSLNELTARVAAHLRRDERNKGRTAVLTSNNLIVNLSERAVFYGNTVVPFSKREFDIIEFLMTNANQVFDKERIYEAVWGYDAEGDSNVIKEHIRKIRGKLNEITGQDYIETIWGVGYKWKRL